VNIYKNAIQVLELRITDHQKEEKRITVDIQTRQRQSKVAQEQRIDKMKKRIEHLKLKQQQKLDELEEKHKQELEEMNKKVIELIVTAFHNDV
jgi:hypothetical protein